MQQLKANLISNDPLVSAIFDAVAGISSEPNEKLKAISRAGQIAEAYLGSNTTSLSRDIVARTFSEESAMNHFSASELQPLDCRQ